MKEWLKQLAQQAAKEIGAELKHQVAFGSHELAAAMFNGSGFVMYPHGHRDDPQHGLPQEPQQQQSRGGMEM